VSFRFTQAALALPHPLTSKAAFRIVVSFKQTSIGRYEDSLEITFEDPALGQRFVILRPVVAIVGDKTEYNALKPTAPYVPRPRVQREPVRDVVPGIKPPALDAVKWVTKLPKADIPKQILSIMSQGSTRDIVTQLKRTLLPESLTSQSYGRYFKNVLWVEETRMR
jgi:helicase MOV-10